MAGREIKKHLADHPMSKYKREYEGDWWYLVEFTDGETGFVPEKEFLKWKNSGSM